MEFFLISQWHEWHFWEISLKAVDDMNWSKIFLTLTLFWVLLWSSTLSKVLLHSEGWVFTQLRNKKQDQVTMVCLVWTVHGHMTWLDYHIENLSSPPKEIDEEVSGPPEEIDKNMLDEDRMILVREKTNMHVMSNIRSFNNQSSLVVFTCTGHRHKWTHNTFLVTS